MKSITIDEAVARMVNIDYIPPGVSLMDFLHELANMAEDDLEEAKKKGASSDQKQLLERRILASIARFDLASYLKQHIEWELEAPDDKSRLRKSTDSSSYVRLEADSVADWARHHYEMGRFNYEELKDATTEKPKGNAEKEAKKIAKKGLSPLLAKRLYLTFAYLLEAFIEAKKNSTGFGTTDNINVSQTAEILRQRVEKFKGDDKNFNVEILKDRIEIAIAMKKLFGKN